MDLASGYIFGSKVGTDFLGDVRGRRRWLKAFGVFQTQSGRERKGGVIERFCVDLCEAAEVELRESRREDKVTTEGDDDAGYGTKPVVYEQLSRRIEEVLSDDDKKSVAGLEEMKKKKTETIASELLDHLIAGHESTGITLTYVMYELSRRPDITKRLRAELLSNLSPTLRFPSSSTKTKKPDDGSGRIDNGLPKPSAIDALPILDAVLQETLRLWQAVPAPQPRVTPYNSSLSIDGYDNIPGGVTVSANAYTLHRNLDVFPNPHAWMPERWLEADKERRQEMKRWLWAFSSGGRMCLGSNFAVQSTSLPPFLPDG
ncbi:MAG: hypothetical protein Q9172_005156 [Xanthocarpia lactea]